MNREEAINLLKVHSDLNKENGYLYLIKECSIVNYELFKEIMESLKIISEDNIEQEQIKDIYSIVFWCRSWMDAGWILKQLGSDTEEKLIIYTEIIESALYYLLEKNVEDAFWAYEEFLNGRYR